MVTSEHRFVLEFQALDGRVLGQAPLELSIFEPAREWAAFDLLRRVALAEEASDLETRVEPIPEGGVDNPGTTGFRLGRVARGGRFEPVDFGIAYFARHATRLSREFVAQARLAAGERFRFRLLAFPDESASTPAAGPGFCVVPMDTWPELKRISLGVLEAQATQCGESTPGEIPVYVPRPVLAEAEAMAEQAGAQETGGILIGHLGRDPDRREIAVMVTAQIPARHTESRVDQLTFTPETWSAVQAALALRQSDEMMLGWHHSHPIKHWCRADCPAERRGVCPLIRGEFFSEDDLDVHWVVFPKPFHVALVVNLLDEGPRLALYGWQAGTVQRRGFHVLNDALTQDR